MRKETRLPSSKKRESEDNKTIVSGELRASPQRILLNPKRSSNSKSGEGRLGESLIKSDSVERTLGASRKQRSNATQLLE